jgi:hypothetical protein
MAQRHQRGWLKKEKRAQGETWVLFFRTNWVRTGRWIFQDHQTFFTRKVRQVLRKEWCHLGRLCYTLAPKLLL